MALLAGVPPTLFLLCVWALGTRYELHPPSEFSPRQVIQQVPGVAAAASLRDTARAMLLAADGLERGAFQKGVADTAAKRMAAEAERHRQRAAGLDSMAAARDVLLAKRHAARLVWVYSAAADVAVALFASLIALAVTLGVLRGRQVPWSRVALVLAAMSAAGVLAALLFVSTWYDPPTPPYRLLSTALGGGMLRFVHFNDGLHIVAVTVIMLAGLFTTPAIPLVAHGRGAQAPVDLEHAARELVLAKRAFRLALYVASAMLVLYVAAVGSLFHWVLAFVEPDPAVYSAVEALANSAVTARGILASGLMVTGFGASAAVLRLMASTLADDALPEGSVRDREGWVEEHGLAAGSLRQHFKAIAAVLAPLATGVLAQVVQSLS